MSNTSSSKRHFLDEGNGRKKSQPRRVIEEDENDKFDWREAVQLIQQEEEGSLDVRKTGSKG